jgi:hypothetical protein
MRRLALLALPLAVAALAGCGDRGAASGSAPQVRLRMSSPADGRTVHASTVEVRGTVRPRGARVRVAGRAAAVEDGAFAVTVPLATGANVIDVAATRPGARTALAALRVVRDDRVTVPALVGDDPDVARARLRELGLEVREERGGGFFDRLLPGASEVCASRPDAGARLARGARVTVVWAKRC